MPSLQISMQEELALGGLSVNEQICMYVQENLSIKKILLCSYGNKPVH